ncbi:MAG: exonuclease subunit SbcD [Peptococcaceae bacterium]|jgi:exonuclease SbcD|nr:exonuclease subunit SbcD [Peptococcaceae bacterium]
MRFLHTADWHLGRTLEGRSRQKEQEDFLNELCRLADAEKADAVLVAGDVFDSVNPPAAAEQLFYDALDELAAGGARAVVVVAGNHDSPERLVAASPLARRHGIALFGLPGADPPARSASGGPILDLGPSWLEIGVPGCDHTAVLLALPYLSETRLKELLPAALEDEPGMQKAYTAKIRAIFSQLAGRLRAGSAAVALSHIFVLGGSSSESERPLFSVGGACTVRAEDLPAVQYTALGHLHRPQRIKDVPGVCRYAGSPLAYSFSEAGQAKSVVLAEVIPGRPAETREIYLACGAPLTRWRAEDGPAQVYRWLEEGRDAGAWIDLEIHLKEPLSLQEVHDLRGRCDRFIDIRPVYPELVGDMARPSRSDLSVENMFELFFEKKMGVRPDARTVALFLEILSAREEGEGKPDEAGQP